MSTATTLKSLFAQLGEKVVGSLATLQARLGFSDEQMKRLLVLFTTAAESKDNNLNPGEELTVFVNKHFAQDADVILAQLKNLTRNQVLPLDSQQRFIQLVTEIKGFGAAIASVDDPTDLDETDEDNYTADDEVSIADDDGFSDESVSSTFVTPMVTKPTAIRRFITFVFMAVLWRLVLRNLFRGLDWTRKGLWLYLCPLKVHMHEGKKYRGIMWCLIFECWDYNNRAFAWMAAMFILIGVIIGQAF
jgi:hypothetical protein